MDRPTISETEEAGTGTCCPGGETREYRDASGRTINYTRHSQVVLLSDVEYGDRFKAMCEGCPHHGKNLSCPPRSPSFLDHIGEARTAKVICIRLPKVHFQGSSPQERYHACFREAGRLLMNELEAFREKGKVIGGSGPCLACEECALVAGVEVCNRPARRIYSLESLGVNLVGLLKKAFGLDLEWDSGDALAQTVCAVGAAFFG